jgi:hypothetical protein
MMALFNATCPAGWTEVTALQGRVPVGVPSGGTLAGTVGTALTNLQDPTHAHGVGTLAFSGDAFTSVINHTHGVTDPGHQHGMAEGTTDGSGTFMDRSNAAAATTAVTDSATTGITTQNPSGGVSSITPSGTLSGSTAAVSTTIPYIQYRWCSKD